MKPSPRRRSEISRWAVVSIATWLVTRSSRIAIRFPASRPVDLFLHRLHSEGKKINAAANANESAHKSDKENERIYDGSQGNRRVKRHPLPLHWLRYVNSFSNKRFLTPELAVIDPSPFATTTGV
jgi:hypothetical protein